MIYVTGQGKLAFTGATKAHGPSPHPTTCDGLMLSQILFQLCNAATPTTTSTASFVVLMASLFLTLLLNQWTCSCCCTGHFTSVLNNNNNNNNKNKEKTTTNQCSRQNPLAATATERKSEEASSTSDAKTFLFQHEETCGPDSRDLRRVATRRRATSEVLKRVVRKTKDLRFLKIVEKSSSLSSS